MSEPEVTKHGGQNSDGKCVPAVRIAEEFLVERVMRVEHCKDKQSVRKDQSRAG